GASTDVPVS
ncbi:hypothetical protein WHR41_09682, partial [Cladosporium halotolerans]